MFEFWRLVTNENMKIYRRARTWVMLGITLLIPAFITILAPSVLDGLSMWPVAMMQAQIMLSFITIFAIVVAADSVAGEFSSGTIKLLLIRPWSRSKILLSKYIAALLFALFFMAALFVFTLLLNWAALGGDPAFRFENQGSMSHLAYLLAYYGYGAIELLIVVTMAFMISSVFRSGVLAIVLAIMLLFGGSMLSMIFAALDKDWADYLLFLHLDLTNHLYGLPIIDGRPFGFSIAVLAVYYLIFIALSWYVFRRRDVAA